MLQLVKNSYDVEPPVNGFSALFQSSNDNGVYSTWNQCATAAMLIGILCGNLHMIQWLCDEGHVSVDPNDYQPAEYAAFMGHLDILRYLHEHGADMSEVIRGCISGGQIETLIYALDVAHCHTFTGTYDELISVEPFGLTVDGTSILWTPQEYNFGAVRDILEEEGLVPAVEPDEEL